MPTCALRTRYGITRPVRVELVAGVVLQLAVIALLWAGTWLSPLGCLVGALYAALMWSVLAPACRRAGLDLLGEANRVTLLRTILIGGVAALVADGFVRPAPALVLAGLAVAALILDGVDGFVARRTGTASSLGARFDVEADAVLVLVLSVHVATSVGPWVLAIGAMRYAFVVAARVIPWLRRSLPPIYVRKVVGVCQAVVLIAASTAFFDRATTTVLTAVALTALVASFGRDVHWLWRTRHLDTDKTR